VNGPPQVGALILPAALSLMTDPGMKRARSLSNDILIVKHFREHLRALAVWKALDLLYLADVQPITNRDAKVLGLTSKGAWRWLSRLRQLQMLEKRGQSYRASPYSKELLRSVSALFRGAVAGEFPEDADPRIKDMLRFAREGTESLYDRGKLDQAAYEERLKLIHEIEADPR
jgi:hypothetical protein